MSAGTDDGDTTKPVAFSEHLWPRLAVRFGIVSSVSTILVVLGLEAYIYVSEYLAAVADGPEGLARLQEFYAPFTNSEGSQATLLGVPLNVVFEDVLTLLAILVPVALTLSLIGAALVARNITRPISAIGSAARAIVGGNLATRVETWEMRVESGELKELIEDFNGLAESLEIAEQGIRENIASIAHELRTPITILNFKLHGFIDGVIQPDDEQFHTLLEQTELLTRLVDDLRTVSLAASGDLVLNRETVELNDMARSVLDGQQERLEKAGLKPQLMGGPVEVLADPDRIKQALNNLIENAIRYASKGGALDITTSHSSDRATIEVSDRGDGLAEGFASKVFHPFSRGDDARAGNREGSGLGLSVVAAIASAHGGSAATAPRPGGGLIVSVTLPIGTA